MFLCIFITFFLFFTILAIIFHAAVCHQNIFSILPNNKINFAVCCYLCISAFRTCCITVIILIYAIHFIPTRNLMKSSVMWWWYIIKYVLFHFGLLDKFNLFAQSCCLSYASYCFTFVVGIVYGIIIALNCSGIENIFTLEKCPNRDILRN